MLSETVPHEIAAFRRARLAAVTAPTGDAALVGTIWVSGPTEIGGFPGQWDLDGNGAAALRYTPPADGSVSIDGAVALESLPVVPVAQGGPVLSFGSSLRATVIDWPGLGLAVRLWDETEAAKVTAIETFAYDPAWRTEGVYTPHDRRVDYDYHGHGGRKEGRQVVGEVAVTVGGRDYALLVTRNAQGLTTVFGDATNGRETYGGGRFLAVAETTSGRAIVDFNQATLPPCAFSPHFDCPLPPSQNILALRVVAGEKRIVRS